MMRLFRRREGVTLDTSAPIRGVDKLPDTPATPPARHVIDLGETYAVCSCGKWHATFSVRGPLPMWARSHLLAVKGEPIDDSGVIPQ